MPSEPGPAARLKREARAFLLVLLLFTSSLIGFWSCGDEDLIFPGQIPPTQTLTPTAQGTGTETPDDEEEDDEVMLRGEKSGRG